MKIKKIFNIIIASIFMITVLVSCKNYSITINGLTSVVVGESIQLTANLETDEVLPENISFIWESENPNIAKVDDTGKVTGVSAGQTIIYASYEAYTGKVTITVVDKEVLTKNILKEPEVVTDELLVGEKIEIALYETAAGYIESNYNPYDYDQINVYAAFTAPSGQQIVMPAFWYRDYEIKINENYNGNISSVSGVASTSKDEIQGLESVVWTNDLYHYRVRVSLDEVGEYSYSINIEEDGVIVQVMQSKLVVKQNPNSNNKGILQVDSKTNRNFVDGLGNTFIPVGVNLCWWTNNTRKTYDYDVWMTKMSENNMNMARLWMATWGFSIHWGKSYNNYNDRLNMAARLDKVFNLADENNIYLQLCLVNHGQFSSNTNSEWAKNPYNEKNGGIIDSPDDFFKDKECIRTYKNEVKYIIARYGYSDKIMAWELFNEVDWTDNAETTNKVNIYNWHKEIGEFVEANDPYNHMITTSYKTNTGMAYLLSCIDYTCPHDYGYERKNITTNLPASMKGVYDKYKKPTIQSEIGINWESGTATGKVDPTGISIRQALWAGMMGGTAGTAMQWWWDSWIHPNNLWPVYNGAGIYAEQMDLTGSLYETLYSNSEVTVSNNEVGILGYKYDDRAYGYLYDNTWWYMNPNVSDKTATVSIPMNNGQYTFTIYDTVTGEILVNEVINIENNTFNYEFTINEDSSFILKRQ